MPRTSLTTWEPLGLTTRLPNTFRVRAPKSGHSLAGADERAPSSTQNAEINAIWPAPQAIAEELPERARAYLQQAVSSIHAPAGAVVTAASAVDAMLKSKNYRDGSLYSRIDKAAADHVITADMAAWAHEVRLDANDQRHADEAAPLPTEEDAQRVIEFATALGQFMYVLPERIARGRRREGSGDA